MSIRGWYLAGVAVVAAALSDPIVESCANRGWLGGRFHDDDHASVIPALLIGLLLVLAASVHAAFARRRSAAGAGDRVARTIVRLAIRDRAADIMTIAALQLCAVYAMESIEALGANTGLPAGLSWLGGPLLVSLALHVGVGIAVWRCAARLVHLLAEGARLLVDAAFAQFRAWSHASPPRFVARRSRSSVAYASRSRMAFAGGRAPPLLALP